MNQAEKDAVTVGEIRKVLLERLENQIAAMGQMLRSENVHKRAEAPIYLKETIGHTFSELDKLSDLSQLPNLIKILRG